MARRAAWVAGGLCGAAVAAALTLYALGLEITGVDITDPRGLPLPQPDVDPSMRVPT